MTSDPKVDIRFECLQCGKTSLFGKKLQVTHPKCAKCGSMTGILGDIGQGSPGTRLRRNNREAGNPQRGATFECLICGHTAPLEAAEALRPKCLHCGALSGVVVGDDPAPD